MMTESNIDADQLYDIYGMIHVPWWQTYWAYSIMIFSIIICSVWAAWYIIKKIRSRARKMTAWEQALAGVQLLQQSGSMHTDDIYYLQITGILKNYVHQRFGLDVHGKTDDEILVCLETVAASPEIIEMTRVLLQESVMIKFAQMPAQLKQKECSLDALVVIIKKTIPSAGQAEAQSSSKMG